MKTLGLDWKSHPYFFYQLGYLNRQFLVLLKRFEGGLGHGDAFLYGRLGMRHHLVGLSGGFGYLISQDTDFFYNQGRDRFIDLGGCRILGVMKRGFLAVLFSRGPMVRISPIPRGNNKRTSRNII